MYAQAKINILNLIFSDIEWGTSTILTTATNVSVMDIVPFYHFTNK